MILSKIVLIKTNSANMKFLTERGYGELKKGNDLEVKIEDLTKGSHAIIDVKCDYCENEKKIMYKTYMNSFNNHGKYACSRKCCIEKKILTTIERYDVVNVFQLESIKEQSKETCKELYGDEYFNRTPYYIKSLMKNYNVTNVYQMESTKETMKETSRRKYNTDYPMQSDIVKTNLKNVFLEKYGVEYPSRHPDIIQKIKNTMTINGNRIPDEDLTAFKLYKRNVINETNKVKKKLLKEWDGYDYYDGEYIKYYYNLHHLDSKYPHIDHKVSMFYGFTNNIQVSEIANINNLCFTKRFTNISKGKKCDNDM